MEGLKSRLQWLMFFRAVITSFFLGIAAITQLQKGDSYLAPYLVYLYGLTGSVYLLTFVYAFVLYVIKNFKVFAYVQIMTDVTLITLLLFITGGLNSVFSFMYSISIISASILLYIFGGVLTATVSSLLYSCLIILQHYHLISPIHCHISRSGPGRKSLQSRLRLMLPKISGMSIQLTSSARFSGSIYDCNADTSATYNGPQWIRIIHFLAVAPRPGLSYGSLSTLRE